MPLRAQPLLDRPVRSLILLFVAWKLFILLIAVSSPGTGYDTSTTLALTSQAVETVKTAQNTQIAQNGPAGQNAARPLPLPLHHIAEKLTRWDAIYFVSVASRGYLFEQEWAFGWGFTRLVALCTSALKSIALPAYGGLEALVAASLAHTAHLFSVIILYRLTLTLFGRDSRATAFTTAALHIISPAGIFLSAPYAESPCAFLSFAGYLNFARSFAPDGRPSASRDLLVILTGVLFGAAASFRSNGILNGLLLLEEAVRVFLRLKDGLKLATIRRLAAAGLGGLFVAAGFLLPQFIAYQEFCQGRSEERRLWCNKTAPSIYSFVQDHYWDVGFLRYWTFSNLPLFLLATPMFSILVMSGLWAWNYTPKGTSVDEKRDRKQDHPPKALDTGSTNLLRSLGVTQLFLTLLTLSTAHVQIITRISSAYPVWLWYAAVSLQRSNNLKARYMVQFMVIYAVIQGGLFASFLPPA